MMMVINLFASASLLIAFLSQILVVATNEQTLKGSSNSSQQNEPVNLASESNNEQKKDAKARSERYTAGHATYGTHQWIHRDFSFELENEININANHHQKLVNKHKSQLEYSCGKAIAEKKYKDFLLNEQGYQVTRNKYRPTEIRMPRIIGGDETTPGEFPWTASIKLNNQPICGGSLIERSWILTAAHCVVGYNPKNLTIRLGAYRIKDISETQTVDLPISMFIVHKEYSMPRPFSNDIALLKLGEPVDYTDFIIPICLPKADRLNLVSMNDYSSNRVESPPILSSSKEEGDETGGIVVSTKMSDTDIAKCFNRLEQNYLQSIGLGPIVGTDGANGENQEAPPQRSSTTTTTTTTKTLSTPTSTYEQQHLSFSLDDSEILMHPSVNKPSVSTHRVIFAQQKTRKPTITESSFAMSINSPGNYEQNNHVYYSLPWSKANNKNAIGDLKNDASEHSRSSRDRFGQDPRKDMIKLSRLPINKELLREIQSVGSGPMQTLGLQQGDFVALAKELSNQEQQYIHSVSSSSTSSSNNEREKITNFRVLATTSAPSRTLSSPFDDDQLVDDPSQYSSGQSGIVVGWGWVRELEGDDQLNKGYPSVTLQKVKLPILRNNVCEAWFQSQSKKITLLPSQFCAGFNSGGKDACRGDSGGPMIIEDPSDLGRFTLVGIVSAGIGCARPSLPGLYTRVASFLPWINAQMYRY